MGPLQQLPRHFRRGRPNALPSRRSRPPSRSPHQHAADGENKGDKGQVHVMKRNARLIPCCPSVLVNCRTFQAAIYRFMTSVVLITLRDQGFQFRASYHSSKRIPSRHRQVMIMHFTFASGYNHLDIILAKRPGFAATAAPPTLALRWICLS